MSERGEVRAQHVFPQPRELRESEREAAVVAEIAEVAKMIREAFALEGECAQPRGARRRRDVGDRLAGLRVGHAYATVLSPENAAGEPVAVGEGSASKRFSMPLCT